MSFRVNTARHFDLPRNHNRRNSPRALEMRHTRFPFRGKRMLCGFPSLITFNQKSGALQIMKKEMLNCNEFEVHVFVHVEAHKDDRDCFTLRNYCCTWNPIKLRCLPLLCTPSGGAMMQRELEKRNSDSSELMISFGLKLEAVLDMRWVISTLGDVMRGGFLMFSGWLDMEWRFWRDWLL